MAHYFTADTHFGDDPVRRVFARPFPSVADMDAAIVTRAGAVGPDDDLWILGDFAAVETEAGRQAARAAFSALPGRKHLIRGNHDLPWTVEQLRWQPDAPTGPSESAAPIRADPALRDRRPHAAWSLPRQQTASAPARTHQERRLPCSRPSWSAIPGPGLRCA